MVRRLVEAWLQLRHHRHRWSGRLVFDTKTAIIGTNSFAASLTPAPDKLGFAVVRETAGVPLTEIVFKTSPDIAWKSIYAAKPGRF